MSDPQCARVAQASGRTIVDADTQPGIALRTPGDHMRQNAQLVLALAENLGIAGAKDILAGFAGTWRRMEVKGEWHGVTAIDDYAHHPVEIRATLAAMREAYPDRRIVCAFQPHTHDRTRKLYADFLGAFGNADLVIVAEVYNARSDIETESVDVPLFVNDIAEKSGIVCQRGGSLAETEAWLRAHLQAGDVLVCMGAGDVTDMAGRFAPTPPHPPPSGTSAPPSR